MSKLYDYDYMYKEYIENNRTQIDIARELGVKYYAVSYILNKMNIIKYRRGKVDLTPRKALKPEKFIEKSKSIHNNTFDYSNTVYKNNKSKVEIRCIKHNIKFNQVAESHLKGHTGCIKCISEKITDRIRTSPNIRRGRSRKFTEEQAQSLFNDLSKLLKKHNISRKKLRTFLSDCREEK